MKFQRHTISVLVENHFGVLARVSGLFSARGFNITSLAVGETEDSRYSRITIVVAGDESILEQIMKQLNKLIDTIKVVDLSQQESIDRELVLVKVLVNASTRMEIMQIVQSFRAKIVDVMTDSMMVEVTGPSSKVDAMLELLRTYGIKEMSRTGMISLGRDSVLYENKDTLSKVKKKAVKKVVKKRSSKKK